MMKNTELTHKSKIAFACKSKTVIILLHTTWNLKQNQCGIIQKSTLNKLMNTLYKCHVSTFNNVPVNSNHTTAFISLYSRYKIPDSTLV